MHHDVTGIILSGGKSSRMGVDKSLLKIGDKTAIELTVNLIKSVCAEIILSVNSSEPYSFLDIPLVIDTYPDIGPLAGIHAGLRRSITEKNFIISSDVPLMNREMIEYLITLGDGAQIVIARAAGCIQPLVGLYGKSILPQIDALVAEASKQSGPRRRFSIHGLLAKVETKIIDPTGLPFYRDELFFNMNNREDYDTILKLGAGGLF